MNLKNYKEWLNAIESELKSTRATGSDVAVVLRSVINIPQKVTSTRWTFKGDSFQYTVIIGVFAHIGVSAHIGVFPQGAEKKRVSRDFIRLSHRYRGLRTVCGDHDTFGEVGRYHEWYSSILYWKVLHCGSLYRGLHC